MKLKLVRIPSGGVSIVGRMYIAAGDGPHGTVISLHGFPGVMMNQDIAGELQERGWNVLLINYRGSWGSQGNFTFLNSLEDVLAAVRYIQQPEVAKQNQIDVERIAVVGKSFGGFLALMAASQEQSIKAVGSVSGPNFGIYPQMLAQNPVFNESLMKSVKDSVFFLNGASAEAIREEVEKYHKEWNTYELAHVLADRHILLTAAEFDEEVPKQYFHDPLVVALEKAGAQHLQTAVFETDHNYLNSRKPLAQTIHHWLEKVLS